MIKISLTLLIVFFFSQLAISQVGDDVIKVGDKLPYFEFVLDSEQLNTTYLDHRLIWINFFATWCPPCRTELQLLQTEIYNKYNDRCDFQLLCIGYGHEIEQIRNFQVENHLNLPFVADQKLSIFTLFAKGVIPRNYLVDRKGVVFYSGDGFDKDEFEKLFLLIKTELGN